MNWLMIIIFVWLINLSIKYGVIIDTLQKLDKTLKDFNKEVLNNGELFRQKRK